jgi:nitrogen fixation/metabolism regulation signal transduction histidine kinase
LSLRAKFIIYLLLIHLLFCAVTGWLLRDQRLWLLAVEGFFFLSFISGLVLVRRLFEPIRLIRSGIEFIQASEFGTRFREVGQSDLDPLIRVYNAMADHLREERIRNEEQEYFLGRIIGNSPSGILTLDLEGRISMANIAAARLLGVDRELLAGRRLEALGPFARDLARLEDDSSGVLALGGRRRVKCQALSFMDRGFARRFLLLDELTEELHRTEKAAYEKLIRVMSHEVNNTTGAVGSLLDSCLGYGRQLGEDDREDFVRAISVAISRTGRMNQFMQNFADVIRLPAPVRQLTDPGRLVNEVVLLMRQESSRRRVTWNLQLEDEVPRISFDALQLERVLINIFKNALEAIGEEGEITVRLSLRRGRPVLVISDTGEGFTAETREHLFSPFYSTKKEGQGIGLTLIREILLHHGFDFSLERSEAGFTEFTILF